VVRSFAHTHRLQSVADPIEYPSPLEFRPSPIEFMRSHRHIVSTLLSVASFAGRTPRALPKFPGKTFDGGAKFGTIANASFFRWWTDAWTAVFNQVAAVRQCGGGIAHGWG
jgi:hypothetical protein